MPESIKNSIKNAINAAKDKIDSITARAALQNDKVNIIAKITNDGDIYIVGNINNLFLNGRRVVFSERKSDGNS